MRSSIRDASSGRSKCPSRAAGACWPNATGSDRAPKRAPPRCGRSRVGRARCCCHAGSAPDRSYAWVVAANGVKIVQLPAAWEIETLVRQYQTTLGSALADPLASANTGGDRLCEILVAPISSSIPPNARVIIAPDGALHGINFETLPVPGAKRHYWIEDVEIQTAPCAVDARSASSASKPAPSLLLFGDPAPRAPEYSGVEIRGRRDRQRLETFPRGRRRRVSARIARHRRPTRRRRPRSSRSSTSPRTRRPISRVRSTRRSSSPAPTTPTNSTRATSRRCRCTPSSSPCRRAAAPASVLTPAKGWSDSRGRSCAPARAASSPDSGTSTIDRRRIDGHASTRASPPAIHRRTRCATPSSRCVARGGTYGKPYYWGPFQMFTVIAD